jgi:hypothetical protein
MYNSYIKLTLNINFVLSIYILIKNLIILRGKTAIKINIFWLKIIFLKFL